MSASLKLLCVTEWTISLLWSCELMRGTTAVHQRVTAVTSPLIRTNTPHTHSHCPVLFIVWESSVKSRPPLRAQWPKRWSCHRLSHWSGFLSDKQHQTAQSTSSDQSSSLHISPFPSFSFPFLSIMVNPTSIRRAPFTLSIPRGGLITPGCFVCLFLSLRSWIEQPAGVNCRVRSAKNGGGEKVKIRVRGRRRSVWLCRGDTGDHMVGGHGRLMHQWWLNKPDDHFHWKLSSKIHILCTYFKIHMCQKF